jgi:hypothetical protein
MRMRTGQRGAGKAGTIISILILAVCAVVIFVKPSIAPPDITQRENQSDPRAAMKHYMKTAGDFLGNQSATFGDVQLCVTEEDWQWFQDNHLRIYQQGDIAGLSTSIDPNQSAVLTRWSVLKAMLEGGPHRGDDEIVGSRTEGDTATLTIRSKDHDMIRLRNQGMEVSEEEIYSERTVVLVKQKGAWKVKDFAGGKRLLTVTH